MPFRHPVFSFTFFVLSLTLPSLLQAQGGVLPRLRAWDAPELMRRTAAPAAESFKHDCPPETRGTGIATPSRPIQRAGLVDVGRMANTYAMLRDSRNCIAHDPKSRQLMVAYRGTDRDTSGDGRSLYVRYARRHGTEWDPPTRDLARGEMPGFPSVFLPNADNAPWPHATMIWGVMTDFNDGYSIYGDVGTMHAGIGHETIGLGSFPLPPNWAVPCEIRMDQRNGDLYTVALGLEPRNGVSTGEWYLLRSTDGGQGWFSVTFDSPVFSLDLVPRDYRAHNMRFDMSPDGSTMVVAWIGVYVGSSNEALLLDMRHEIQWCTSSDQGMSWGILHRQRVSDIAMRPGPFESRVAMTWDLDVVFDYQNRLHALVVCSSDLDVFDPFAEAGRDGQPNPAHVDSTFVTEILIDGESRRMLPVGPVRRIRTDRRCFTEPDGSGRPFLLRNEPKWARNYDGTVIYAKWISPAAAWMPHEENGLLYLVPDTLTQVYVNGRHVDTTGEFPWYHRWVFEAPSENPPWRDSLMRVTSLADIGAKCTQIARYAGDGGQLHIAFVEWDEGAAPDSEPVRGDQIVWYIEDVVVPVLDTEHARSIDPPVPHAVIEQVLPHPVGDEAVIGFRLDRDATVRLQVTDFLGRVVLQPVNGFREAGRQNVSIHAADLPSGVYLVRLESGGPPQLRTIVIAH